jgi:hypothetical protein
MYDYTGNNWSHRNSNKSFKEKHSIYSLQKTAVLATWHKIRKILCSLKLEAWAVEITAGLTGGLRDLPPIKWVPVTFPGLKRPEREASHSPASSAEVENKWSYIPIPSICVHSVYKEKLTVLFFWLLIEMNNNKKTVVVKAMVYESAIRIYCTRHVSLTQYTYVCNKSQQYLIRRPLGGCALGRLLESTNLTAQNNTGNPRRLCELRQSPCNCRLLQITWFICIYSSVFLFVPPTNAMIKHPIQKQRKLTRLWITAAVLNGSDMCDLWVINRSCNKACQNAFSHPWPWRHAKRTIRDKCTQII